MNNVLLSLYSMALFSMQIHAMNNALPPIPFDQNRSLALEKVKNAIRNLAAANNTDPLAIIPHLEPIKPCIPQIPRGFLFCEFFDVCIRDTTALNWLIHATKGNLPAFSLNNLIPDLLLDKKYVLINEPTDIGQSDIIRMKGKSYKEDAINGIDAINIEELKGYCIIPFHPTIYFDLIDKEVVRKDIQNIKTYLLCLKAQKNNLKVPKPVNLIVFAKSCRHIDDAKDCWDAIENRLWFLSHKENMYEEFRENCKKIRLWHQERVNEAMEKISFEHICNIIEYHFPTNK